jgi:hypothetical protein
VLSLEELLILLQVFIATVFVFSGTAKLFSRFSFLETLLLLGFTRTASRQLSWVFPIIEIAAAGMLVYEPLRLIGELMLLLMLFAFIVISIRMIRSKQKVDCQCFGDLVEEPMGTGTIVRSIVLAACVVPLLLHQEKTGLYALDFMEIASVIFTSLGILIIYALAAAYRGRITAVKGGK